MAERIKGANNGQMGGIVYEVDGNLELRTCAACMSTIPCALRSKAGACNTVIESVDLEHKPVHCGSGRQQKIADSRKRQMV